jgi:hypothetical protein
VLRTKPSEDSQNARPIRPAHIPLVAPGTPRHTHEPKHAAAISAQRNRRSAGHGTVGIVSRPPDGGSVTRHISRDLPSDAGSVRWRVEVVRGAPFKSIEEEKGLGGWGPAPRRGIRTVGITDSAITGSRPLGPPRHLHRCRLPRGRRPVTRGDRNSAAW